MSPELTPSEQDLVDLFESFSPAEKARALRALARDEADPKQQRRLIMAALRMDAVALNDEPRNPAWPKMPDTGGPFVDDAEFLPKNKP